MSDRPTELPLWAVNLNHAAGSDPWSGQPNKVTPAAGKILTGRLPEEMPPAEETNWWRDVVRQHIDWLQQAAVRNFLGEHLITSSELSYTATYDPFTSCVDLCLDAPPPSGRGQRATVIGQDTTGPTTKAIYTDAGGMDWGHEGNIGGASTGTPQSIDANDHSQRIATKTGALDAVYYSSSYGAWALSTIAGTPGLTFSHCCGNNKDTPNWVFLIGAAGGQLYKSTDGGVNFSANNTLTGNLIALAHSKDPQDLFMAVSSTQCKVSDDDGASWSTYTHSLSMTPSPAEPMWLFHDPLYQRWSLCIDGNNIAYSDNNGQTWTTVSNTWNYNSSSDDRRIIGDRKGHVIAMNNELVTTSIDGGKTWRGLNKYAKNVPFSFSVATGAVKIPIFNHGRFSIMTRDTVDDLKTAVGIALC